MKQCWRKEQTLHSWRKSEVGVWMQDMRRDQLWPGWWEFGDYEDSNKTPVDLTNLPGKPDSSTLEPAVDVPGTGSDFPSRMVSKRGEMAMGKEMEAEVLLRHCFWRITMQNE